MKKLLLILLFLPIVLAQDCDCNYNDECFDFNTQRIFQDGIFYCDADGVIFPVKFEGEECKLNYECQSFFCDTTCKDIEFEEELSIYNNRIFSSFEDFNYFFLLAPFIVIILIIALIWFIYSLSKIHVGKKTEKIKVNKKDIKIMQIKRSGKDDLEESIKKSMKDVKKIYKKNK